MVTGRRPFEHTNQEATVVQKVLSGNRPERSTVGFSDPLWALLVQVWLGEYESLPPARPNIVGILEQLQDEVGTWDPTSRSLALRTLMEQTTNRMSSTPQSRSYVWLTRKSQR